MIFPVHQFFLLTFLFFCGETSSRKVFGESCYDIGPIAASSSSASSSTSGDSASASSSASSSAGSEVHSESDSVEEDKHSPKSDSNESDAANSGSSEVERGGKGSRRCPVNEVFSKCGNNGCINTCIDPTFSWRCRGICNPGCICIEGYVRNDKGKCIDLKDCESCGGDPNAVFDKCGDNCPITCMNMDDDVVCGECRTGGGCKCRPGFVRNYDDRCIRRAECIKYRCGVNEVYSGSGDHPCANTCDKPQYILTCKAAGKPGCGCIAGYLRNDNGKCVAPEDCDECYGDPNAVFNDCGDRCPVTCANKDVTIPCREECVGGGCICRPGFIRISDLGRCIDRDSCPICGPNEFFDCGSPCDRTCATLGQECPIVNVKCTEMCYCAEGYARDADGVCIPVEECPQILECGLNEVYNHCPDYCSQDQTCEMIKDGIVSEVCDTHPSNWHCIPRCQCKPGYVREGNQCLEQNICCNDPNAEVVNCPNPCPGGTCERPDFSPCKAMCQKIGCQCKKGYVKNKNGKCIKLSNCPKVTPKPLKCSENEEYFECPPSCPLEKTCEDLFRFGERECRPLGVCTPMCRCKTGYVRNKYGKCVLPGKCCEDPNTEFVNNPPKCCGGTCAEPKLNSNCRRGCPPNACMCKRGYVWRNDITDNTCILLKQCRKNQE